VVVTILAEEAPVFAHVFATVEHMLSPTTVMLDASKRREERRRRTKVQAVSGSKGSVDVMILPSQREKCRLNSAIMPFRRVNSDLLC
jgi:hypothetical protein